MSLLRRFQAWWSYAYIFFIFCYEENEMFSESITKIVKGRVEVGGLKSALM